MWQTKDDVKHKEQVTKPRFPVDTATVKWSFLKIFNQEEVFQKLRFFLTFFV